ncbi:unnamed protein product [Blepharisma stoltei]|uniref:Uncharacterized protein n=1 Tax=Blepharisma stoltei TaxID=1481888 RepID=A0AAU9K5E1_9CILI|nr:unnamed protein product [Blepharisma stoltei]
MGLCVTKSSWGSSNYRIIEKSSINREESLILQRRLSVIKAQNAPKLNLQLSGLYSRRQNCPKDEVSSGQLSKLPTLCEENQPK